MGYMLIKRVVKPTIAATKYAQCMSASATVESFAVAAATKIFVRYLLMTVNEHDDLVDDLERDLPENGE